MSFLRKIHAHYYKVEAADDTQFVRGVLKKWDLEDSLKCSEHYPDIIGKNLLTIINHPDCTEKFITDQVIPYLKSYKYNLNAETSDSIYCSMVIGFPCKKTKQEAISGVHYHHSYGRLLDHVKDWTDEEVAEIVHMWASDQEPSRMEYENDRERFVDFLDKASRHMKAGKKTAAEIEKIKEYMGIEDDDDE